MFASQSRARIINSRMAVTTASKGASTISDYFLKMKGLADNMVSTGKKLEDEELVSYILSGLDLSWDPVVIAISTRAGLISVSECLAQLIALEQRFELKSGGPSSSVNIAAHGGRGNRSRGKNGGGRGGVGRGGFNRGGGGRKWGTSHLQLSSWRFYQICGKEGHPVHRCYKRYDSNYSGHTGVHGAAGPTPGCASVHLRELLSVEGWVAASASGQGNTSATNDESKECTAPLPPTWKKSHPPPDPPFSSIARCSRLKLMSVHQQV